MLQRFFQNKNTFSLNVLTQYVAVPSMQCVNLYLLMFNHIMCRQQAPKQLTESLSHCLHNSFPLCNPTSFSFVLLMNTIAKNTCPDNFGIERSESQSEFRMPIKN